MSSHVVSRPDGIPGSDLGGPWPVGAYAAKLRNELRKRARLQLFGEVWNLRITRARVWFELRDAAGALPCAMWRTDFEALGLGEGALEDGAQVVVAGGPDFYPGSRTASPAFSFAVTALRVAGDGDLLAQLDRLRKLLDGEGLCSRQAQLARPALPRAIGVVCAQGGKAGDDVRAGLERRGWAGRLVWAYAPVQDRHAAPRVTRVLQDLAASGLVDVVIVARGGGSLADLFCFCDETLCRTVALLPVPVIASVGHHTDRTLIDDVAAVSCSTPTHAAEAAVSLDVAEARAVLAAAARRLDHHAARAAAARPLVARAAVRLSQHARQAVVARARALARLSRAPADHVRREQARLHQQLREIRAAASRRAVLERSHTVRRALVLARKGAATQLAVAGAARDLAAEHGALRRAGGDGVADRRRDLDRLALALAGLDPQRTLERGYALVEQPSGGPVTSAAAALDAADLRLRFADGSVAARVTDEPRVSAATDSQSLFEEHP